MPRLLALPCCLALAACSMGGGAGEAAARDTVVVFTAASLAPPMRDLLASFARRTGAVVQEEHGASLELARRITELGRVPDVIALADEEVFPQLLEPAHVTWHASFARNRMVIAYTAASRGASEIGSANWHLVLQRPGVRVGRGDPERAPAGYRALLVYALAESHYRVPGLAARLAATTPPALIRGSATELAALLEAGELDYIVEYESLARANGFRTVKLPAEIDLGDAAQSARYATARVRVRRGDDSVTITGAPARYALAVPRAAPHPAAAERLAAFVLGAEGRMLLRGGGLDVLEPPVLSGARAPLAVRDAAAR